jgi:hypothetical protein
MFDSMEIPSGGKPPDPAGVAALLFDLFQPADDSPRASFRFLGAHAVRDFLLCLPLKTKAQLLFEFPVNLRATRQRPEP